MKRLNQRISFILLILSLSFTLTICHSLNSLAEEKSTFSTLENIENFFNSRGKKIEKFLTNRDEIEALLNEREALTAQGEDSLLQFEAHVSKRLQEKVQSAILYKKIIASNDKILQNPNLTDRQRKDALVRIAKSEVNLGNCEKALLICQELLEKYPASQPDVLDIYHLIGNRYQGFKRYNDAIDIYQEIIMQAPQGSLAAHVQVAIGWCYYIQGYYDDAIIEYQRVIDEYPYSDSAPLAQYWLAQSYFAKGNIKQSLIEYQRTIENYPNTIGARHSQNRLQTLTKIYPNLSPQEANR